MKKKSNSLANLSLITYIGVYMTVPIIVGLFAGQWIDKKLNTTPIFLFVFIIMGVVVAFMNLFKVATKDMPPKKGK
ncbi:MAG: AtpZ/AtpI family protein [Clostridiales bacterium]|nr:AtpZ/AtpI family protein [Clostridiales bacterium]